MLGRGCPFAPGREVRVERIHIVGRKAREPLARRFSHFTHVTAASTAALMDQSLELAAAIGADHSEIWRVARLWRLEASKAGRVASRANRPGKVASAFQIWPEINWRVRQVLSQRLRLRTNLPDEHQAAKDRCRLDARMRFADGLERA